MGLRQYCLNHLGRQELLDGLRQYCLNHLGRQELMDGFAAVLSQSSWETRTDGWVCGSIVSIILGDKN